MNEIKYFIQKNGGKIIISVFINDSDIYSLLNDGSWKEHEWSYEPEFNADLLMQSKLFNSIQEAVDYIIKSNNLPAQDNSEEIYSYQIFANQIPTENDIQKAELNIDNINNEDVVDVMLGAFSDVVDNLQTNITDNILG